MFPTYSMSQYLTILLDFFTTREQSKKTVQLELDFQPIKLEHDGDAKLNWFYIAT